MDVIVTQENLAKALNAVSRVATSRTQLPILSNILIRADGSSLHVAATNLEVAVTVQVGAKINKPGAITVPARLVTDFTSSLPRNQVELKVTNERLSISSEGYSSTINGVIADEFPELPTLSEEVIEYGLVSHDLKQALTQTIFASSSDSTRPILTGVFWNSHEGDLYLAATDGYRLAEKRVVKVSSEIAAIVPTTSLQEVLRLLGDDDEEVRVLFDETQVKFQIGSIEVTSRLIDGNYPDYRQLIPTSTETNLQVDKSEFARIIKIASLFARDSGGGVAINADGDANQLSVRSIASEYGENSSTIDTKVTGGGVITLNSRYVTDVLSVLDGDKISFGFNGKMAPSLVTAVKDDSYRHIVMPLKS